MQRCELAEECAVCNVPFCPYSDGDMMVDGLYGDEEREEGDGQIEDDYEPRDCADGF